jgi:hypothetical protein
MTAGMMTAKILALQQKILKCGFLCVRSTQRTAVTPIPNPLSTACADLLAPDSYLVHNSCKYFQIVLSSEDLLRQATSDFHRVNGSWWMLPVLPVRISDWYCGVVMCQAWKNPQYNEKGHSARTTPLGDYMPPMPPKLVLEGVSFPFFALLALDNDCHYTFNKNARRWTLNFNSPTKCASALEVEWPPVPYWGIMGIEMEYSHEEPGKVTVSVFRPVQRLIAAPTTPPGQ